jgi:hypothetical protein
MPRSIRESLESQPLSGLVLVETIAQADRTRLPVNGVQVEAMREDELQDAYREVYRQYKPDAGSDAIGEARRRALRDMQERGEIAHGTVEGVVYWWFTSSRTDHPI